MLKMPWLDRLPGKEVEGGIPIINQLYWNISVVSNEAGWFVMAGGEDVILQTDSPETAQAFLYGLGLAYAVLPEEVFKTLQAEMRRWVE